MKKVTETIKIKGEKKPLDFEMSFTHRGAVMDYELLQFNSQLLFGDKTPNMENNSQYSFGWTQS